MSTSISQIIIRRLDVRYEKNQNYPLTISASFSLNEEKIKMWYLYAVGRYMLNDGKTHMAINLVYQLWKFNHKNISYGIRLYHIVHMSTFSCMATVKFNFLSCLQQGRYWWNIVMTFYSWIYLSLVGFVRPNVVFSI